MLCLLSLTGCLFCELNNLIDGSLIAVNLHHLVPLLQAQRCYHELAEIFGVSHIDHLITCTWNRSSPVLDVDKDDQRCEVSFDVWHAVVVEEQAVVELGPLEVCLAKDFEALLAELIRWDLEVPGDVKANPRF